MKDDRSGLGCATVLKIKLGVAVSYVVVFLLQIVAWVVFGVVTTADAQSASAPVWGFFGALFVTFATIPQWFLHALFGTLAILARLRASKAPVSPAFDAAVGGGLGFGLACMTVWWLLGALVEALTFQDAAATTFLGVSALLGAGQALWVGSGVRRVLRVSSAAHARG